MGALVEDMSKTTKEILVTAAGFAAGSALAYVVMHALKTAHWALLSPERRAELERMNVVLPS